jgi:cell fate regulator YaaT (PSP1 superfamily)
MVIGHQRGRDTKENLHRNFGMPHPEGYRKALRLMKLAEKFHVPIITMIDTPGAWAGLGAEERGQSEAIARNLLEMSQITVPIVATVIGEGGSGGALALGVADRILMMENSVYSVITVEGCAAILWKDGKSVEMREKAASVAQDHGPRPDGAQGDRRDHPRARGRRARQPRRGGQGRPRCDPAQHRRAPPPQAGQARPQAPREVPQDGCVERVTAAAVQTHLVEVEFKGNRRAFFTWSGEAPPPARAAVIVQVERGEDLGRVHATGELAEKRKAGTTHGKASPNELPRVVRLATKPEIETAVRLRADEDAVRRAALEIVRELKLDMKVSDAEWQWDRRRLTCYFTAEERVDFRQLVRQLEKRFGARVHMWHIGVRDEARRLDGIGRCGRQFCSSSWLPELRPVKSSSAKDQRLSTLNPAQISGTCGRLMCCLRYEHEFYVQSRKRFPKEGKVLETAVGEEKVVSNDIFRDQVTLRTAAAGEYRTIPLNQLKRELGDTSVPVDDEPTHDDDAPEESEIVTLTRAEPPKAAPSRVSASVIGASRACGARARAPRTPRTSNAPSAPSVPSERPVRSPGTSGAPRAP